MVTVMPVMPVVTEAEKPVSVMPMVPMMTVVSVMMVAMMTVMTVMMVPMMVSMTVINDNNLRLRVMDDCGLHMGDLRLNVVYLLDMARRSHHCRLLHHQGYWCIIVGCCITGCYCIMGC